MHRRDTGSGVQVTTSCHSRGRARACVLFFSAVLAIIAHGSVAARLVADEVIGAKDSKVYHLYPDECGSAKRISPGNRISFKSAEEAERAGRRLCKRCEALREKKREQTEAGSGSGQSEGSERSDGPFGSPPPQPGEPGPTVPSAASLPQIARVTGVLPGGTIELDIGEKARLVGVVCPQDGQVGAEDAVRFITEQTQGRTVRLFRDASLEPSPHRDALGRLLVHLTPEPDGRDLGGELIFQGFAWLDRDAQFARRREYTRREEEAWRAPRGIWKPEKGAAGNHKVVTGRHAHHYHDPNCRHIAHLTDIITLTLNEAKSRRLPPCPLYGVKDSDTKKQRKDDRAQQKPKKGQS
ncbi:MAG: thermonuclease family protein [Planctomycetota bacterium]